MWAANNIGTKILKSNTMKGVIFHMCSHKPEPNVSEVYKGRSDDLLDPSSFIRHIQDMEKNENITETWRTWMD